MKTPSDLSRIADQIVGAVEPQQLFELSLDEFREVFRLIRQKGLSPRLDIVLNGETAAAQFTGLCNHRVLVLPKAPSNIFERALGRRVLQESDFAFDVVLKPNFHGQRNQFTLVSFAKEEIRTNWVLLLVVVAVCLLVFNQLGSQDLYLTINQAIIASATLFVTIFLLFTVSQNSALVRDLKSFETGQLHRWFAIDRFVALVAIASLVIAIVAQALLTVATSSKSTITIPTIGALDLVGTGGVLTIIAILLLADCFSAITEYYFQRIRAVVVRDLTEELLDKAMDSQEEDSENKSSN